MNVKFEKEICSFLNLPSIPLKEWDGETAFDKGVAIVKQAYDGQAYAVARFDPIKDAKPTIIKVFDSEPFFDIEKVLVVPDYMETSVETADLDEESMAHNKWNYQKIHTCLTISRTTKRLLLSSRLTTRRTESRVKFPRSTKPS